MKSTSSYSAKGSPDTGGCSWVSFGTYSVECKLYFAGPPACPPLRQPRDSAFQDEERHFLPAGYVVEEIPTPVLSHYGKNIRRP